VDVNIHIFLNSAPVGGEWPDPLPGRSIPGEKRLYSKYEEFCTEKKICSNTQREEATREMMAYTEK
jgi:hypothetical protein